MERVSEVSKTNLKLTRTPMLTGASPEQKRNEILEYFHNTFSLYEELFTVINSDGSYFTKPEPLRHPLIFYLGHTATFFINKFVLSGIISERVNPKFEGMFAVGVDEMDWDDLNESHYDWPSVREVLDYRKQVRELVDRKIRELPITIPISWESPFWIVMMGIEHERIHLETSSVIIRRLPISEVHSEPLWPRCPETSSSGYDEAGNPKIDSAKFPSNELLDVEEGSVKLGKFDGTYGWDNEYGHYEKTVPKFKASKYIVTNYEYLQFIEQGGYENEQFWTEEGWKWNMSTQMKRPLFWVPAAKQDGKQLYKFRTLTEEIDMPWDWPVETNNLEAKAYCNWKASKTGKAIRLPTEDEWYRLRDMIKVDLTDWEFKSVGNINLELWASSCPVNKFQTNGFYDIVGNVWQHTETPIDGFEGFMVHPSYDDFSTPTFDTKHNLIKGGSWISTGNEALRASRYAFRRHFYQHAGFRYVESQTPVVLKNATYETDSAASLYLEFHYGAKVLGVENYPKRCADTCVEVCRKHNVPLDRALDLGCAVGRSTFELGRAFSQAIGIDLSAWFFQLAVRLKEQGKVRYSVQEEGDLYDVRELDMKAMNFDDIKEKVQFFQQDASNMDLKKFNNFDLIFAGNLIDRMKHPRRFLENAHLFLKKGGVLVLTSPYTWLPDFTEKKEWIGGFKENGENLSTYKGLQRILKQNFREIEEPRDIDFVIRETKRKHQHTFAQATFWQKLSE